MYNNKQVVNSLQGSQLAFVYIFEFKQLTCDILGDKVVLMNQFQFGLRGNVKDLMLTISNPMTLSQIMA
jgi:hypothetical protein